MRQTSKAIGAIAGSMLLLAGCTSRSAGTGESSSPPASTSHVQGASSAIGSTVGAVPGSSEPLLSTAPSSDVPSSSAPVSTGPASSSAPVSTGPPASSAPVSAPPVSTAAPVLDPASTRWLTTYCTTILPVMGVTALQSQISSASGDLTKIKALFVRAFQTAGSAMTATATTLKGQSAPALTAAGSDLPGLLSRIGALGAELTTDGSDLGAIDPVKQAAALGTALTTRGPDIDKIATVVGTKGGLKLPVSALPEIGRIAACSKVITTG